MPCAFLQMVNQDGTQWKSSPSSVWKNLHANSVSGITHFLSSPLPLNTPWELSQWSIRRLVRAYASNHELNSNDADVSNITSYNTRVERVVKIGDTWRIRLRKLKLLPRTRQIEATWWTEVRPTLCSPILSHSRLWFLPDLRCRCDRRGSVECTICPQHPRLGTVGF
jgi:hypothetical protein